MTSTEHTERLQAHHDEQSPGNDPASNRSMSIPEIQASYAEYADRLHQFELVDCAITGRYRRARFCDVSGKVLDVACGTGTNFRYLPESADLVGIDISPEMLANAEKQLAVSGPNSHNHTYLIITHCRLLCVRRFVFVRCYSTRGQSRRADHDSHFPTEKGR